MCFETIKKNFERGLWTKQMVAMAVRKGVITPEQYSMITGEDYSDQTEKSRTFLTTYSWEGGGTVR